jgi:hypothetical protein
MGMTLKQVGRVIPHYNKPIIKPIMKVGITPELAEEIGLNEFKPKFPAGQQKFKLIQLTMRQFLEDFLPSLEVNPELQRLHVQSVLDGEKIPTKSQGIIECIFNGYDVGVINVREYSDGEKKMHDIEIKLEHEMEDGSNRVRSFDWFTAGNFEIHPTFKSTISQFENIDFGLYGKFSRTGGSWPQEVVDYFYNYVLIVKVFEDMTEEESSTQFIYTNKNTKATRQQERNGKGRKNIAKLPRDLVRGKGVLNAVNKPHELFAYLSNKSGKHIFPYLNYTNDSLIMEEQVAQICYRYWLMYTTNKGGEFLGVVSQDQLDYMYEQTHTDKMIDKLREAIKKHLNFILKIAKQSATTSIKLSKSTFHLYSRLYFMMLDYTRGKEPKLKDFKSFHNDIKDACTRIDNIKDLQPDDDKERTVAGAFKAYFGKHDDIKRIHVTRDLLLQQINFEYHIKNFDSKRCISREKLEVKWRANDKKCSELGVEISFDECQGGHIISVYNEGRMIDENIDPMHRVVNNHMSKMNRDEWRKLNMLDGKIISQSFYVHIERHASKDLKKKLKKAGIWNQSNIT